MYSYFSLFCLDLLDLNVPKGTIRELGRTRVYSLTFCKPSIDGSFSLRSCFKICISNWMRNLTLDSHPTVNFPSLQKSLEPPPQHQIPTNTLSISKIRSTVKMRPCRVYRRQGALEVGKNFLARQTNSFRPPTTVMYPQIKMRAGALMIEPNYHRGDLRFYSFDLL